MAVLKACLIFLRIQREGLLGTWRKGLIRFLGKEGYYFFKDFGLYIIFLLNHILLEFQFW